MDGVQFLDDEEIETLTNVRYHLDWIEEIVGKDKVCIKK